MSTRKPKYPDHVGNYLRRHQGYVYVIQHPTLPDHFKVEWTNEPDPYPEIVNRHIEGKSTIDHVVAVYPVDNTEYAMKTVLREIGERRAQGKRNWFAMPLVEIRAAFHDVDPEPEPEPVLVSARDEARRLAMIGVSAFVAIMILLSITGLPVH